MMVVFFLCGPALCLTPEDVQRYIEAGAALDLHDDNLRNYGGEPAFSQEDLQDKRFMALVRGKVRTARCINVMQNDAEEYGRNLLVENPGAVIGLLCRDGKSLSPVGLAGRALDIIVRPLELEQVLLDLPRYYEAVVNTPDWEKKFSKILSQDYVWLDKGVIFHLAGFPEMETEDRYTSPMNTLRLSDDSFYLDEAGSSMEAWLYSFWMRRWKEGNMEAARLAVDWLNNFSSAKN
jgi:hypothetical protein